MVDDSVSRKFRKLLKKLDLYETKHGDTRHFHNLRHTFAVRKYCQTSIYRVKLLLGHASIKTTEKYTIFTIGELEKDFDIDREEEHESEKDKRDSRGFSNGISDRDSQRMYGVS